MAPSVPVVWRHSLRARRVGLRIDPRANAVVVTLPPGTARAEGLAFLADHMDWAMQQLAALPPALIFANGTIVPVDGIPCRVRHVAAGHGAWFASGDIHVAGAVRLIGRRVMALLRAEAAGRLPILTAQIADRVGLRPSRVTIRDPRTRWGSCAPDGTVMVNWRLVMAPVAVQHAVLAHELAHLRHMNHGAAFWELVRSIDPAAEAGADWLRQHGPGLMRAGPA